MQMFRRYSIMAALLMILFLSACHKKVSQELIREQPGGQVTKEAGSQEKTVLQDEAGLKNKDSFCEETGANTDNKIKNINNKKINTHSGERDVKNNEKYFYYEKISEKVKSRINGKSYGDNCDIPYEELRYVRVLYWGFDAESHEGELIVNKLIADDMIAIFKELYEIKYPIEKMVLVDDYDADDDASMAADNTSSFNYRKVDGTEHLSQHSYGLAIDINPRYNPYVKGKGNKKSITPENGKTYADRSFDCKYYIKKGDACYKAFTERGFTWGGEWKSLKDYQHFQKKKE